MELLYCPLGDNGVSNPFSSSMTSLEKVLKTGEDDGTQKAVNGASLAPKRKDIVRGVLSVTVISADNLPAVDMSGKSDPYVILSLKKTQTKNKTRVSVGCPNTGISQLSW